MTHTDPHPSSPGPAIAGEGPATAPSGPPFYDLDRYVKLPRLAGLRLSPDGTRLVVAVQGPDPAGTGYTASLWQLDPAGTAPAHRLTRGAKGESAAAFTSTGDLLFTAKRPDPEAEKTDDDEGASVWLLPAGGGEARLLVTAAGGVAGVTAARTGGTVLLRAGLLPGAADLDQDRTIRKARAEAKVTAILHTGYPVRFWDHDLGPDSHHLLAAELDGSAAPGDRLQPRDVTTGVGAALLEQGHDLHPDGSQVVTGWWVPAGAGDQRATLVEIDVSTGERRTLATDPAGDLYSPRYSWDGNSVSYLRETASTPLRASAVTGHLLDLSSGNSTQLAPDWDRWPNELAWLPDGSAILATADDDGRGPIFRIDLADSAVRQLTSDDAVYTDLCVAPDGSAVFALRSSCLAPAHPVRIALAGADAGVAVLLPAPHELPEVPGTLAEVRTTAADGTPVRGWLVLPGDAGPEAPAPLLLWIHGGPLASWNTWSWRWNPWLMAARGYAVLLPDPGLSTGYGQDFVQRGWGAWGREPYTDLLAITDAAQARPDIDETRTAAMGGSFGGYMANWVAGHTDRFAAIVTHASLWALDDFGGTTDVSTYWRKEMTPEMAQANSPHLSVASITTPMLVIHGDKDYRVPIGQGLRLWYELLSSSGRAADEHGVSPHRFLYFPTENHWILTPNHAKLWYQVVLDFLDQHVLGAPPAVLPELLGGPAPAPDRAGGDGTAVADDSRREPAGSNPAGS